MSSKIVEAKVLMADGNEQEYPEALILDSGWVRVKTGMASYEYISPAAVRRVMDA